jgi:hypothetical protein
MDKGIKDCDDAIGDLALLKTVAKTDLVSAFNEQNDNLVTLSAPVSDASGNMCYCSRYGKLVHIDVYVYSYTTANTVMVTLPSEYRPMATITRYVWDATGAGTTIVTIGADGTISINRAIVNRLSFSMGYLVP